MTTAIDTNVIVALWDKDAALNSAVQTALDSALERGGLVIAAPVFAELLAFPGRDEAFLDAFIGDTGIYVDWELDTAIWRRAGRAFQGYAARRRKQRDSGARRILADFIIGAHAVERRCELLTLDAGLYRAAFPEIRITTI